ncbi:VOC family protein [Thalassococcus sp. BH17M4-6]|uniref:VOC family protein n=1 Tax=Thalassococcus sp. BH17M4-6 TaxID=3413148 RepID=UPI003BE21268
MLTLDHIAVLGETLEEAAAHTEAALGQSMLPGGKHGHFATHNRLLGLADGLYIEAIAIDPAAPPPPHPRWFGLDGFRGAARLDKWICRTADMYATLAALPMAGRPVKLARDSLRWTMAVPEDGQLPFDGLFPAIIQWHSPVPPGNALANPALQLERLTVSHPQAEELKALLAPHLDAPNVAYRTGGPGLEASVHTPQGLRQLR